MSKVFYLSQKLETESIVKGELTGLAYSGSTIPYFMGYQNFIVDISTTTVAKAKTPLFRDHNPSLVVGHGKVTLSENDVQIVGKISKKTANGQEVIDLAEEGLEWEMSIGVFEGKVEEVTNEEINGVMVEHGWALRNGIIREVSVVALGADLNTNAQILSQVKGEHTMFTKEQWAKFACGCGGSKDSTPEELQAKFEEATKAVESLESEKAKIEALNSEIETLKAEILAKQEEINKIKAEDEEADRVEEIEVEMKAKGLSFSAEKIKAAAKTKESTEMLLSFIKEIKPVEKKIDEKFAKNLNLGAETSDDTEAFNMKVEEYVKSGKATDKMDAILKVSKELKGAK